MAPVVQEVEKLWETWNIRVCILLSFFIQVCLTFLAPWRKVKKNLSFAIWMLYLLADAIALYTIGLISNNSISKMQSMNDILVFWSPFLLVHLGGPDTITALSLEDNEIWLRHLLQLATQSTGTLYLFYRALRTKYGNEYLIPASIMYVNGCVKYLERTTSLYYASMETYRESLTGKPDAGPNYGALMEEYASRKNANIPVYIKSNLETSQDSEGFEGGSEKEDYEAEDDEMKLVKQAHGFYLKFRGLIADTMFTFKERTKSRQYFLKIDGRQAFKVIQIELNFMYDVFFTKVNTLHRACGMTRMFSFAALTATFLLFYLKDAHKTRKIDLIITYVLLGGAFTMEVIAVVMLSFSDWAVVGMVKSTKRGLKVPFFSSLLCRWLRHHSRRWCQEIPQYDFLYSCLNHHSKLLNVLFVKRLKDVARNYLHVSTNEFDEWVEEHIFKELKEKSIAADTIEKAKKACEARGDLVFCSTEFGCYSITLKPWTLEVDYDESLLLWHIATNLCIFYEESSPSKSYCHYRKCSKVLADYMMYLLIVKPSMTSSVAGIAQVRLQDTCEEAKNFIFRKLPQEEIGKLAYFMIQLRSFARMISSFFKNLASYCSKNTVNSEENVVEVKLSDKKLPQLCKRFLDVNTEPKPIEVKGDQSKSVMFDACRLAKKLIEMGKNNKEKQWEVTFKVWVELLCYAACRGKPTAHLTELREGGELITMVWLLMAQLGLGEEFRIGKGTGWAKLIVQK